MSGHIDQFDGAEQDLTGYSNYLHKAYKQTKTVSVKRHPKEKKPTTN